MKLLSIHSDFFEYETRKKAIKNPEKVTEENKKGRMEECLSVFMSIEKIDESDTTKSAEKAVEDIKKNSEQVNTKNIMLYPFAHLSSDLAQPNKALEVINKIEKLLKKEEYNVKRAPFGWYKSFNISCKGHPLSELSSQIDALPEVKAEKEAVSEALKAEEKLKSHWYIMDVDGKLIDISKFDFTGHDKLKTFAHYEKEKDRTVVKKPAHIHLMRKLELVDYEPASDPGNMRYYPKGRLIKKLLEEYVSNKIITYGGVEVETPIMYDIKHPSLEKYLNKFPARQYQIASDKRTFFLRFAACFGQFLMAHDATISYKNLPLKLYELTRYSFRREQSGELAGLRRLRAFTMPDVHALCSDMEQAKEEYQIRFDLCVDVLKGAGIEKKDYELGLRITKEFYEKNKDLVMHLLKKFDKPILLEMWDKREFYFVLKYEFNFVDSVNKAAALSTDQIDVENADTYDINYNDKDGKKKRPLILHCSPSGAIERVIYAILEIQAEKMARGETPEFPLWLAPSQVRFIPVSVENHLEKCKELCNDMLKHDIRADIDDSEESIGKRVRQAEKDWVPYILVVGDQEIETDNFKVRIRGLKEQKDMGKEELVKEIDDKTKGFPFKPLPLPVLLTKRPKFVTIQ